MRGSAAHTKSLEAAIAAFFFANPDEELTIDDAIVKFDAWSHHSVCNQLGSLAGQGMLERVSVYRLKQGNT